MQMPDVTSFISRSFQEKAGWSRIGFAFSVLIVGVAGATLFYILRDIDISRVLDAIGSKPMHVVALAAGFIGVSYVMLTFYDFFSLHTIGCGHVPYRVAALASFTSYSIGHNLGATVFTAGAVRWRIYSAWKLSVADVAKMAFVTGLTFWLGNIVVLGIGMVVEPEAAGAVDHLPALANQAIGAAGLAIIAGYVLWLIPRPRTVGIGTWFVTLPGAPLTLVQIGIGVIDLCAGGLALYVLLPVDPAVDFTAVLVIYVAATLLGFLSHSPGSLGVFEAAVLIALPQFAREELVASLLLFRCLYFVLPLILALLAMAARELRLSSRSADRLARCQTRSCPPARSVAASGRRSLRPSIVARCRASCHPLAIKGREDSRRWSRTCARLHRCCLPRR
jgi:uncharacterized membrane protein YbhN (UPF0104 family)